jgi:catechol 2,3-dioxygenase-like lactoylglutathione lyase family enzyme
MDQRIDLITLRVEDLDAATRFYVDGLGWTPMLHVPGEVTFLQSAHGQALSLFDAAGFDADAGQPLPVPVVLAHIVDSEAAVDRVMDELVAAGATVVMAAERAEWGGYHGFVRDPAGYYWDIAHNPGFRVDPDGTPHIGPVDG